MRRINPEAPNLKNGHKPIGMKKASKLLDMVEGGLDDIGVGEIDDAGEEKEEEKDDETKVEEQTELKTFVLQMKEEMKEMKAMHEVKLKEAGSWGISPIRKKKKEQQLRERGEEGARNLTSRFFSAGEDEDDSALKATLLKSKEEEERMKELRKLKEEREKFEEYRLREDNLLRQEMNNERMKMELEKERLQLEADRNKAAAERLADQAKMQKAMMEKLTEMKSGGAEVNPQAAADLLKQQESAERAAAEAVQKAQELEAKAAEERATRERELVEAATRAEAKREEEIQKEKLKMEAVQAKMQEAASVAVPGGDDDLGAEVPAAAGMPSDLEAMRKEVMHRYEVDRRKNQSADDAIELKTKENNEAVRNGKLDRLRDLGVQEAAAYSKTSAVGPDGKNFISLDHRGPLIGIPQEHLGPGMAMPWNEMPQLCGSHIMEFIPDIFSMREIIEAHEYIQELITLWQRAQQPCKRFDAILRTFNIKWEERLYGCRKAMIVMVALLKARNHYKKMEKEGDVKRAAALTAAGRAQENPFGKALPFLFSGAMEAAVEAPPPLSARMGTAAAGSSTGGAARRRVSSSSAASRSNSVGARTTTKQATSRKTTTSTKAGSSTPSKASTSSTSSKAGTQSKKTSEKKEEGGIFRQLMEEEDDEGLYTAESDDEEKDDDEDGDL